MPGRTNITATMQEMASASAPHGPAATLSPKTVRYDPAPTSARSRRDRPRSFPACRYSRTSRGRRPRS